MEMVNQEAARMQGAQPKKRGMMDGMSKNIYGKSGKEEEEEVRIEKDLLMDLFNPAHDDRMKEKERKAQEKEEKKRLKLEIKRKKKVMQKIQKKIKRKRKQQRHREKLQILAEGECNMSCIILQNVRGNIDPDWERKLKKIAKKNRYRPLTETERSAMRRVSKLDPLHMSKLPKIKRRKEERRSIRRSSRSSKGSKSASRNKLGGQMEEPIPEQDSISSRAPTPPPPFLPPEELREQERLVAMYARKSDEQWAATRYDSRGKYDEAQFVPVVDNADDDEEEEIYVETIVSDDENDGGEEYGEAAFEDTAEEPTAFAAQGGYTYSSTAVAEMSTSDSVAGSTPVSFDLRDTTPLDNDA